MDALIPNVYADESWLAELNSSFNQESPRATLKHIYDLFGDDVVMATGFGASGIVLMHLQSTIRPEPKVFYLDTDFLFPQTYALRDRLAEELNIQFIRVHSELSPAEQEAQYGTALWDEAPDQCCFIRKVAPLRRFLSTRVGWITGVRRDQSASRRTTQVVEWDKANNLIKFNPLAHWTREEVWGYIRMNELPYNPLHDQGYPSIGCMPCTRAVVAGESIRAGRWTGRQKVECGIHVQS